jgi:hypothetical protein
VDQAFAFLDGQYLIRFQIREVGRLAAGPSNFERINFVSLAQPEMQARILRGLVARTTFSLIVEN